MGLKARMEAVIYAAEEPVTLAQLAALFAGELAGGEGAVDPSIAGQMASGGGDASADGTAHAQAAGAPEAEHEGARKKSAAEVAERKQLRDAALAVVNELIADYNANGENARGMEIREVAGGYRMSTRPEYHDTVRGFIKGLKPALKLSLPALETLAVIAYKQPITAPEISEIRGVDSSGVLGSLLTRKLIATAGRKPVVGRPILYKTTREFLLRFGLKDVNELPSLEEFEKMAAEVSEFEDGAATEQDKLAFEQAEMLDDGDPGSVIAAAGNALEASAHESSEEVDSLAVEVEEEQQQP